jgi:hypothetical protein
LAAALVSGFVERFGFGAVVVSFECCADGFAEDDASVALDQGRLCEVPTLVAQREWCTGREVGPAGRVVGECVVVRSDGGATTAVRVAGVLRERVRDNDPREGPQLGVGVGGLEVCEFAGAVELENA